MLRPGLCNLSLLSQEIASIRLPSALTPHITTGETYFPQLSIKATFHYQHQGKKKLPEEKNLPEMFHVGGKTRGTRGLSVDFRGRIHFVIRSCRKKKKSSLGIVRRNNSIVASRYYITSRWFLPCLVRDCPEGRRPARRGTSCASKIMVRSPVEGSLFRSVFPSTTKPS